MAARDSTKEEAAEKEEGYRIMVPLPSSPSSIVGIAIDGKSKSKDVIRWALDKFIPEGRLLFMLLHIRPQITSVPTPMGNLIPISQVREDVATAYRKDVEWQTTEMLLPFKKMITRHKKAQADVSIVESDDVAKAIAEEVKKFNFDKLVIGAAARGMFTRRSKKCSLTSRISNSTPSFCTVYVISKGKLSSIRPSNLESNSSIRDDSSETNHSTANSISAASYGHRHSASLPMQRFQALSNINRGLLDSDISSLEPAHPRSQSMISEELDKDWSRSDIYSSYAESSTTQNSSFESSMRDPESLSIDQGDPLDTLGDLRLPVNHDDIVFELEKLRVELRHVRGMHAKAHAEAVDASRKADELKQWRLVETEKLENIKMKERKTKELVRQEKDKYENARKEAINMMTCAQREARERKYMEMKTSHDLKENQKLENALHGHLEQYQVFKWEEILSATSSLSESCKIGKGAYGAVYKCSLHHTNVAVKIIHQTENLDFKQFQQELEILSKVRHPHLLLLIGACPDHGCLIYEYMENGTLEERLLQKDNTPPIPWFSRFRIASEVASALVFLHNCKPKPIIHRDIKPSNILLDHNFVSKIGDVGLSTMLHSDESLSSVYDTRPAGTLCYIDPEYQRTGQIFPESDVYALGIVILQLLTSKPAIALAHTMEKAIENGSLMEILDHGAGNWPLEETRELAILGLRCAEVRRRDRPDLGDEVLPALQRFKEAANRAMATQDRISTVSFTCPNHFICPILKEVMKDPCVAADGISYERKAIEKWIEEKDKSPITNLPLPHKYLTPNYSLLSAINEWNSMRPNSQS